MRPLVAVMTLSIAVLIGLACIRSQKAFSAMKVGSVSSKSSHVSDSPAASPEPPSIDAVTGSSRTFVIVGSLTVFVLSVFVGFEIIAKVPPTLHTPLMSGSNAISGITVVGAIIVAGYKETGVGCFLGMIAIVLAMINVVGGFAVTHRMLLMFKKR